MKTIDFSSARWRKSSRSGGQSGQCVEIARLSGGIAVRDSKDPDGTKLVMNTGVWRAFTARIRTGRLDLT